MWLLTRYITIGIVDLSVPVYVYIYFSIYSQIDIKIQLILPYMLYC